MRAIVIAGVLAVSATAHAGAAIFVPPAEVDLGVGAPVGGDGAAVVGATTEILAGLHWASLAWHPTNIDVGVGYVGSRRDVLPGYSARIAEGGAAPTTSELDLQGGYLSLAHTIPSVSRSHWRTWVSARGELLHGSVGDGRSFSALGGALRVQSEVYLRGAAAGSGAAISGSLALGLYIEASHRDLAPELGPDSITSGISIRLPFILAGS